MFEKLPGQPIAAWAPEEVAFLPLPVADEAAFVRGSLTRSMEGCK